MPSGTESLKPERFSEAEWVRDSSFVPPATFKLDDFVDDAFGAHVGKAPPQRVVIEFSKERASKSSSRPNAPSNTYGNA